jgi:hypothetical protein
MSFVDVRWFSRSRGASPLPVSGSTCQRISPVSGAAAAVVLRPGAEQASSARKARLDAIMGVFMATLLPPCARRATALAAAAAFPNIVSISDV